MTTWRVGNHYRIHVYETATDRPVATFHDPQDAERCVKAIAEGEFLREALATASKGRDDNWRKVMELRGLLQEARLQIEYLHGKFSETGSGVSVLARIDHALRENPR